MTKRTNYRGFIDETTKELVLIKASYLTRVKKTTRASKWGKRIICPHCNSEQTVYHFSWSDLMCTKCKEMVDKYDWWVATNPTKFSKRLTLCDPKVKYYVDKDSVDNEYESRCSWSSYTSDNGQVLDATKGAPKSINSHF